MGLFGCYERKLLFTVEEAFITYLKVDKNDGRLPVNRGQLVISETAECQRNLTI